MTAKDRPERASWRNMIHHCYNPDNHYYPRMGALGIRVCDRWRDREHGLENFMADLGPKPSRETCLKRRDSQGDYTPENTYWGVGRSTAQQVEIDGVTRTWREWSEITGIAKATLAKRVRAGLSPEEIFRTDHRNTGQRRGPLRRRDYLI